VTLQTCKEVLKKNFFPLQGFACSAIKQTKMLYNILRLLQVVFLNFILFYFVSACTENCHETELIRPTYFILFCFIAPYERVMIFVSYHFALLPTTTLVD